MSENISLTVNGQPHQTAAETTIAGLLEKLGLAGKLVAIEVNLDLVPRQFHDQRRLVDGDQVEIVTLVGGG
jgi:sulfur carrier protein